MPTILQAARTLTLEVAGNQRVGRVDDAVVPKKRKRVRRAERKARPVFRSLKSIAQLDRQTVIETVAGGGSVARLRLS